MGKRHLVTAATLVVAAAVLVVMALWGVSALTAPMPSLHTSTGNDTQSCSKAETTVKRKVFRKDVTVSVFNAGGRTGEAGDAQTKLETAGFVAGDVGNAPAGVSVKRAVVWTTKKNDSAALLVAKSMGKKTKVVVTTRDLGAGVDVLVGPAFHGLDKAAPRGLKLAKPVTSCVRVS